MTLLPPLSLSPKTRLAMPWVGACYVVLLGFLVYTLAHEARLDTWRNSSVQTGDMQRSSRPAANPGCAELAGMGQKLCGAEAKFDTARARFQERFAARREEFVLRSPVLRDKRRPAAAAVTTADLQRVPAALSEPALQSFAARD